MTFFIGEPYHTVFRALLGIANSSLQQPSHFSLLPQLAEFFKQQMHSIWLSYSCLRFLGHFYSPSQFYHGMKMLLRKRPNSQCNHLDFHTCSGLGKVQIFSSSYLNTLFASAFGRGMYQGSYRYTMMVLGERKVCKITTLLLLTPVLSPESHKNSFVLYKQFLSTEPEICSEHFDALQKTYN